MDSGAGALPIRQDGSITPPTDVNVAGKATALTALTPVRWWGVLLLRPAFWIVTKTGITLPLLRSLSFIHYARFALLDKDVPFNGPPQRRERLGYRYMYFESNFNGTWDEYIDAFAEVMPSRFQFFFGSSLNFPGPMPTGPFRDWIARHEVPCSHYYSAYEEAPATVVLSAISVQEQLSAFVASSKDLSPAAFRTSYEAFLTRVQRDL
ncbi:MAG: hypothetical protein NVSMB32_18490 [Actinomycetota bacterium]